jgi:Fe-S-cluster containining protein
VDDHEVAGIAELLGRPIDQVLALYTRLVGCKRSLREKANGDCIFYDSAFGCTVYPKRPKQCRTWPFWESNLATPEEWEKTRAICPGSGHGELISAKEITHRLKVIRI